MRPYLPRSATFCYQFLPGWIAPTLTSVPLLCLASSSFSARVLGSGYDGVGFLDFSFDWSAIGQSGPLYTPPWALVCYFAGMAGMLWIVTPLIWCVAFSLSPLTARRRADLETRPCRFADIWDAQSFSSPVSAGLYNSNYTK